jgi:hypothetical protein
MKKIVLMFAMLCSLWGCSNDNKLSIQNLAQETIYVNFRASVIPVQSNTTRTLTDIPNGTYDYNTTYTLPAGATSASSSGDAASGQMSFDKKNTQVLLLYSSTLLAGVYTLYVNESSTDPVSTTSPTSVQ